MPPSDATILRRGCATLRSRVECVAAAVADDPGAAEELDAWARRNGYAALDAADRRAAAAAGHALLVLATAVRLARSSGTAPEPAAVLEGLDVESPLARAISGDEGVRRAVTEVCAALSGEPDAAETLAACYEGAMPTAARRARGQFSTPPPLAAVLVRWALPDPGPPAPRVLDPGVGTGTVLAAARDRLVAAGLDRPAVLDALVGVDVDPVALDLASLRVSAPGAGSPPPESGREPPGSGPAAPGSSRGAFAGGPRTYHASFFDLEPDGPVGPVDAVVGNPPFVRAEDLSPDADHYRRHLSELADGSYATGERRLSRRSDAYVYFVTHATRFLREGGRLAFVLPTKWLQSAYGEDLQRFLRDHYRVRAIVGFAGHAFDDALVDTCLLLAERRADAAARGSTDVRFVRLDDPGDPEDVLRWIEGDRTGDGRPWGSRVVSRRQDALATGKLHRYLTAPEALLSLLSGPSVVPLSTLASVSRGVMTGANEFFFLDPDDVERWGVEDRFLAPARKSMRGLEERSFDPADVDRSIVDVHDYVSSIEDEGGTSTGIRTDGEGTRAGDGPADAVKRALARDGYDGLLSYVRHAESAGWHEGATCRRRRVWFDLGPLPVPDVFVPKLLRERVFVIANRAGAVPSNAIDCLSARDGVHPDALVGLLESSLARATMEVWGRDEAGMLQLMTYETETLPVPDLTAFSREERGRLAAAARALLDGEDARDELDAAVLDPLDADLSIERVQDLARRLGERRVNRE